MDLLSKSVLYKPIMDALDRGLKLAAFVVSGCAPSAAGIGLQVNVAAGTIVSNGAVLAYGGGNQTHSPADANNPRVDIGYLTSAGALARAEGVPLATQPLPPALPANAVLLYTILMTAGKSALGSTDINVATITPIPGDGSAAAPGWPISTTEPNTGWYKTAAGKVGLSVLGTKSIELGNSYIAIGTNPATIGTGIRYPNDGRMYWRNAANTGDLFGMNVDGGNNVNLGESGMTFVSISGGGGEAARLTQASTVVFGYADIRAGSSAPATAGIVRVPNGQAVTSRNAANTANYNIGYLSGTDTVNVGNGAAGVVLEPVFVSVSTPAAQTGYIRVPQGVVLAARNAANTGDITLIDSGVGVANQMRVNDNTALRPLNTSVADATGHLTANTRYWQAQ